MNKVGRLLEELQDAEGELASEYRVVAEREAAEQDVYYMCQTLAKQCDGHVVWTRGVGQRFDTQMQEPDGRGKLPNLMAGVRHKASELLGRRAESGLLLLRDLRQLYLMAEEANIHWLVLGQVAQAVRDGELLNQASALHKETLTQIKWIKTRIKESAPQVLIVST